MNVKSTTNGIFDYIIIQANMLWYTLKWEKQLVMIIIIAAVPYFNYSSLVFLYLYMRNAKQMVSFYYFDTCWCAGKSSDFRRFYLYVHEST